MFIICDWYAQNIQEPENNRIQAQKLFCIQTETTADDNGFQVETTEKKKSIWLEEIFSQGPINMGSYFFYGDMSFGHCLMVATILIAILDIMIFIFEDNKISISCIWQIIRKVVVLILFLYLCPTFTSIAFPFYVIYLIFFNVNLFDTQTGLILFIMLSLLFVFLWALKYLMIFCGIFMLLWILFITLLYLIWIYWLKDQSV